jgi:hypothetical protein
LNKFLTNVSFVNYLFLVLRDYQQGETQMKNTNCFTLTATILVALALAPNAAAQFASTAKMLGAITSTNQSLWNSRQQLERTIKDGERFAASGWNRSNPAPAASAPVFRHSIAATDFRGLSTREMPEQLARMNSNGTPEYQTALRSFYHQLLDSYEGVNRKNNVAAAVAYAVGGSLEISGRRVLTQGEINYLVAFINETLAKSIYFRAMTTQQKQALYENSVIVGGAARAAYAQAVNHNDAQTLRQADELAQGILRQWVGM